MKIKNWFMLLFILVMILPIIALYFLYLSISKYDQRQEIKEFMQFQQKFMEMKPILENHELYKVHDRKIYRQVQPLVDETIVISLYRADGLRLYTSSDIDQHYKYYDKADLYENLNEMKKNYRTYSIKVPVFHAGELVGIYEVAFGREQWMQGVKNRTGIFALGMIMFFIILYASVLVLVHRKLNRPLSLLRRNMSAFANGHVISTPITHRNDEIGELIQHFEQMKEQIELTRMELKQEQQEKEFIVASLSHDLKTPLTVIQAYNEALLKEPNNLTNQEKAEYKQVLLEKVQYMKGLLDDLAMYTALQSKTSHSERVQVDGEEFFEMLFSGYDESCSQKGLFFSVEIKTNASYIVNTREMIRIVDNLMGNAIRHTKRNHRVGIGVISHNYDLPEWIFPDFKAELDRWRMGGTVFFVQNEGKGIPLEEQEHVFVPFYQVEGARGTGGSSGLGLSITKMLIEEHEGKIKLWSTMELGTLIACWIEERE